MTRHTFGQSLTDWTMDVGTTTGTSVITAPVIAKGPVAITFWSAKVGGVQYTDLIDPSGSVTDTITSSDGEDGLTVGAIPEFQGPDGVAELWADGGSGTRYRMVANDLGANIADLLSTVASLQETVELLAQSPGYVLYNTDTSSWPDRPSDSRPYLWIGGPGAPAAIPATDIWINTVPA